MSRLCLFVVHCQCQSVCHILINFLLYRDLLGYTCYRLTEYELVCGCQNAFRSGIIGYVHPYMRTSHPYMHSVCYASAHVISCSAEVYTNQQITDMHVVPTVCNPHISITHSTTVVYQNIAITDWQQTAPSEKSSKRDEWKYLISRHTEKAICWTVGKMTVLMQNVRGPACLRRHICLTIRRIHFKPFAGHSKSDR